MSEREVAVTPEGLRRIEKELSYLRTVRRQEVAERIKQAREYGDIAENPEFEDAKNEQAFVEGRIHELEETLRRARVIEAPVEAGVVTLGSRVVLRDLEYGDVLEYTVVGPPEVDPLHNRISHQCPVGRAIMGQRPGTVVEVEAPAGTIRYQILEVYERGSRRRCPFPAFRQIPLPRCCRSGEPDAIMLQSARNPRQMGL